MESLEIKVILHLFEQCALFSWKKGKKKKKRKSALKSSLIPFFLFVCLFFGNIKTYLCKRRSRAPNLMIVDVLELSDKFFLGINGVKFSSNSLLFLFFQFLHFFYHKNVMRESLLASELWKWSRLFVSKMSDVAKEKKIQINK